MQYDFGIIGLGTMGRNLALNMCDHGFTVSGFDKDAVKVELLKKEGDSKKTTGFCVSDDFIKSLKKPRTIILLVPAGKPVDAVVDELKPLLDADDLIIDCGNSHFTDTDRRINTLAKENLHFMGVGVSGGETGARHGPSIMPGGDKKAYERVSKMFEAISAKVNNEPCVTYLGIGSAGHYVKMVHNGIEYGLMQLLAEAYHLLKLHGFSNIEMHKIFSDWNNELLQSFLVSITADIFEKRDDITGKYLVDVILDAAHQKGTGTWTSESAMELQIAIPSIDNAVSARYLSSNKAFRVETSKKIHQQNKEVDRSEDIIQHLQYALRFAFIVTYTQGMSLLYEASKKYNYQLDLSKVAAIWRGGCIIRSSLLEIISDAYKKQPQLESLLLNETIANELVSYQSAARYVVALAADSGIPAPVFMSCLAYYDSCRSAWLPSNLIQAQRDYFGAHTYERIDREGFFHTQWTKE